MTGRREEVQFKMDGWLEFNVILSIQVAAIACLQFKMGFKSGRTVR